VVAPNTQGEGENDLRGGLGKNAAGGGAKVLLKIKKG